MGWGLRLRCSGVSRGPDETLMAGKELAESGCASAVFRASGSLAHWPKTQGNTS